jgi:hypothetical protein
VSLAWGFGGVGQPVRQMRIETKVSFFQSWSTLYFAEVSL